MGIFDRFKKSKDQDAEARPQEEQMKPEAPVEAPRADQGHQEKTTSHRTAKVGTYDYYINYIGDTYVAGKELNLTPEEIESMTVTDLAEAWRLFVWLLNQQGEDPTPEKQEAIRSRIERVANALARKLVDERRIYVLFNKLTDEPHLFTQAVPQENGQMAFTSPQIRIFTEQSLEVAQAYDPSEFEIVTVDNTDGQGIINFLGHAFYVNGADGVEIISPTAAIPAAMVVEAPDFSEIEEVRRPIMNPDLKRWMLLMAQLGEVQSDEAKQRYAMFAQLFDQHLLEGRFLAPTLSDLPEAEEGVLGIPKGTSLSLVTMEGKDGRKAVQLFTDWVQFHKVHGPEYKGWIVSVQDFGADFDLALNPDPKRPHMGVYLTPPMVDSLRSKPQA